MDKVYIYINDCIRWSGGINILIQIISSLNSHKKSNFEIIYVKPSRVTKLLNFLRLTLRGGGYKTNKLIDDDLFSKFEKFLANENLELSNYSYSKFKKLKFKEFVFPVMKINTSLKNKNLVGYIPDCQHIHLPELFRKWVSVYRDYQFSKVKKYCKKVIATSNSVLNDLVSTYGFEEDIIFNVGFNPIRLEKDQNFSSPIEKDYFLIANQLWEHKNHIYAIRAFKKYIELNPNSNTKLLCTGYIHDHRNSLYSQKLFELIKDEDLKERVVFLGYLSRKEFLNYLVFAKALIQPTLFEGTPGSLSTADAVSYGVDVFLSDIQINREVNQGNIKYFDINNINSLVMLLNDCKPKSINERLENSKDISTESQIKFVNKIILNTKVKYDLAVFTTSFTKWSGGTRLIIQFIDLLNSLGNVNVFIVSKKLTAFAKIINLFKYNKNYNTQMNQENRLKDELINTIKQNYPKVKFISSSNSNLKNFIVFPLLDISPKYIKNAIYFIPDIGHKELKQNFNLIIRFRRYIQIRLILSFSKTVLVNSQYIKNKIMESYKNIKTNIYSAPFYGFIPDFEKKVLNKNFINKFTNKDYLIVSNQFWAHKNHITAIKAVELLNKTLDEKVNLICTGFMYDYRGNHHTDNIYRYVEDNILKEEIIFTDFLERSELLNLIKNSIGLIQPSFYEGGPGGFSTADAIALNKRVYISDIEINKEIEDNKVIFFKNQNEKDLFDKLITTIGNKNIPSSTSEEYKTKYIEFLHSLITAM